MALNSSDIFSMAMSGVQSESSIGMYKSALESQIQNIGGQITGWLAEKSQSIKDNFKNFYDSRLWEYGARIGLGNEGEYVGRFDIGYLGSVTGLQSAQGLMRNYIMAHEGVGRLYKDELISGYDGDFSENCTGIGRDNIFWRMANNGVTRKEEIDGDLRWLRSHFTESNGNSLSFRERVNIQRTWRAIDYHLAEESLDITSASGEFRKDYVDPNAEEKVIAD